MLGLTSRVGSVLVTVGKVELSLPDLPLRLELFNPKLSFPLPPPLLSNLELDLGSSKKRDRVRRYRLDEGSERREKGIGRRRGGRGGGRSRRRRLELAFVRVRASFHDPEEGGEIFG